MPSTFDEILVRGRARWPDRPALVCRDRTLTYCQLEEMSRQLAEVFVCNGINHGDRVALVLPNGWHFVVAAFAAVMAGALVVPLDFAIRPGNFAHIIDDCAVKAVVLDYAVISRLESALKRLRDCDLMFIKDIHQTPPILLHKNVVSFEEAFSSEIRRFKGDSFTGNSRSVVSITYTSGSTGAAKGVMHSHESWLSSARYTAQYLGISAADKMMISLPLHHAYSFRHILSYLMYGGTVAVREDFVDGLKCLQKEKPNALLLVPAACNIILKHYKEVVERCAEFIDFVSIGTASISSRQLKAFQKLLPNSKIHLPYGLTEARVGFLKISNDDAPKQILSAAPNLQICVLNGTKATRTGETGEIVIKGEGLMVGYWQSSEVERERLRREGFRTGDMGRLEKNGAISLLGRMDDMIKIGGRKVIVNEVESVLNGHPCVHESVVFSAESENGVMNIELRAIVVLEKDKQLSENELREYSKKYLEPYKIPAAIEFRPAIERSSMGKVLHNSTIF